MTQRQGSDPGEGVCGVHRRRTRVLGAAWILAALALGVRAGHLQLGQAEHWRDLSQAQNAARVEVPAPRGGIYDRSGTPLALPAQKFRGYLAPEETPDAREAAATVARQLGLTPAQERRLRSRDEGWVAFPRTVTVEERNRLLAAIRGGLHFERLSARVFPQGPLARPLIGTVGAEGEGRSGLEMVLDSLLRGEPGSALRRRDAMGGEYQLPDAQIAAPHPGHDVRLTLDADLQRIAEDALDRALRETGSSGGDVLMLDPATGEILAVASRRVDGGRRVAAFTDAYEPGSTLKPFLLASLLAEDLARLDETVDTEGGVLRQHGRTIRDVHPEDSLAVADVIRFSSNVGAAKLARRLSPGLQYRYLRDFGFGVPTGVLYPSESPGTLRRPEAWSALSQASLAMGYEISVTSLQLAAAYAALANGGVLMRPYLVREVRAADGRVLRRQEPRAIRRVVSREVADRVTRVLGSVVEGGTATRAALATLPVAGKTGTARMVGPEGYQTGRYSASFVGYTPVEDPALVVLAKLDDPQGSYYGGLTAAPITRSTLQAALATRGVALPHGGLSRRDARRIRWSRGPGQPRDEGPFVFAVSGPPEAPSGGADDARRRTLPDLRGLAFRTAAARLHELGLRVAVHGSGRVRGQDPPPGARVSAGATVRLR